ncbi:MAG: polyprenol monophosphomannose synthase [Flavobacteriales bacterium]|nr:polyprenol monophosphomannose synthase [Flavobacteriales bacterium]
MTEEATDSLVIIPTYNEKDNVEDIIDAVISLAPYFDVLIVDDGSPDGTGELVKKKKIEHNDRVHLLERRGKLGLGTAYIAGFNWGLEKGRYKYLFEMDADFSHNPDDLLRLRSACLSGADFAIGSRYVEGGSVVDWSWERVLLSYGASWYVRTILGMPIKDPTAGFKCYKKDVLEIIDLEKVDFVGYAFQIAMKYSAISLGFKAKEVPIRFKDREKGQSKMSIGIFKEALTGVWKMKRRNFRKNM